MNIKEVKNTESNPHKMRFDAQMEILNPNDLKKMKDKHFHFYIFEEVPVQPGTNSGKSQIQNTYKPVLDCDNLAVFDNKE